MDTLIIPSKSLSIDDARELLQAIFNRRGADWTKKRDFAVLMLLYGAGLRISEALGLFRKDAPLGEWLSITGKGGKMRDVPVLRAASEAEGEEEEGASGQAEPLAPEGGHRRDTAAAS